MYRSHFNRREFLAHSSLIALAPTVPAFLSRIARAGESAANGRILVVIQMSGGNDGINTVVPFADEGYVKHRDKLRIRTDELIKINDQVGLHPALRSIAELLHDGRLAIVQGVGYPNPDRSHDVSMAIWQTARFDPTEHKSFGWIGRAMDDGPQPSTGSPQMLLLGTENPPIAIRGRRSTSVALAHLQDLRLIDNAARLAVSEPEIRTSDPTANITAFVQRSALDAYAAADLLEDVTQRSSARAAGYPSAKLGDRLRMIAQLIKADFGTPVYYAVQDGYDTHAGQLPTHQDLLSALAQSLRAFLEDLKAARLDDRVVVLCFSEFGRRVAENASLGTDHGTAGPVIVAGRSVRPGLIGEVASLSDLDDGDLKMGIDFRQIYAAVLEQWLGLKSAAALGGSFSPLNIVKCEL